MYGLKGLGGQAVGLLGRFSRSQARAWEPGGDRLLRVFVPLCESGLC